MYRILIQAYVVVSQLVFNEIYKTSERVIDEEFHIPQGIQYCNFNFSTWDPKITTLPGLYIISAIFLGPFKLCSVYFLRYTSFIGGIVNLFLFHGIFKKLSGPDNRHHSKTTLWLSAVNVSMLPPLYFFNTLYYTDVLSLTFLLIMFKMSLESKHFLTAVSGSMAILMRQTNVIWMAFVFGRYAANNYFHRCLKNRTVIETEKISIDDIKHVTLKNLKNVFMLHKLPVNVWNNLMNYLVAFSGFILFLIINKGIVVGDKSAHVAVIHLPQLFYFALFCLIFGWPHFITSVVPFLKYSSQRKYSLLVILILMVMIIHYNTLVHPYLLADNRHYTFYIWNRFYEGIFIFRYLMIVPYLFGLYSVMRKLYTPKDISFILIYVFCTTMVLIPQKLIEVRYFLVPFVLFRLNLRNVTYRVLIVEFIYYLILNTVTLRIFFDKNIYWADFDYVQKLIW